MLQIDKSRVTRPAELPVRGLRFEKIGAVGVVARCGIAEFSYFSANGSGKLPRGRTLNLGDDGEGGHFVSHHSIAEARARLTRLARAEIIRLGGLARLYAVGLGREAFDELLGEAITRVLERRRAWPRDLAAVPFLAGVMRSIADEWRSKGSRDPLRLIGAEIDDEQALPTNDSHEKDVAARLLIEKIREKLSGEPLLLPLFELRLNEKSPAEIQSALGLDATAFDSATRALKRRLVEIFPGGYPL
jgi:hypothetical protein